MQLKGNSVLTLNYGGEVFQVEEVELIKGKMQIFRVRLVSEKMEKQKCESFVRISTETARTDY